MKNSPLLFPLAINAPDRGCNVRIIRHVLERDGRICQMCGADESCLCPFDQKKVSLFVRLIAQEGSVEPSNMRTICSTCADGLRSAALASKRQLNAGSVKPDRHRLLAQIRRATLTDQKVVLEWLLEKFKLKAVGDET